METKKSIKRENFLVRVLTQARVGKIMSRILSTELTVTRKRKSLKRKSAKIISEAQTLADTRQALENKLPKGFPRIESAGQMDLFEAEKEGPKPNQVTRAVSANFPLIHKKTIFHVHCKEEEFKEKTNTSPKTKQTINTQANNFPTISAFTPVPRKELRVKIDFSIYSKMILESAYERFKVNGNTNGIHNCK